MLTKVRKYRGPINTTYLEPCPALLDFSPSDLFLVDLSPLSLYPPSWKLSSLRPPSFWLSFLRNCGYMSHSQEPQGKYNLEDSFCYKTSKNVSFLYRNQFSDQQHKLVKAIQGNKSGNLIIKIYKKGQEIMTQSESDRERFTLSYFPNMSFDHGEYSTKPFLRLPSFCLSSR